MADPENNLVTHELIEGNKIYFPFLVCPDFLLWKMVNRDLVAVASRLTKEGKYEVIYLLLWSGVFSIWNIEISILNVFRVEEDDILLRITPLWYLSI